jgi:Tol biopolymer transport system component
MIHRLLLFIMISATPLSAQTMDDLYQRALRRERVTGDLKGAIDLYQQVARGPNRPLAARALLRMGEAYEKLGQRDAIRAYQRIIQQFADQTEVANDARRRIALLEQPSRPASSALTLRRVGMDMDAFGSPTPDGRFFVYTDWDRFNGNLAMKDLVTGEVRQITRDAREGISWAVSSRVSSNGRLVAIQWSAYSGREWQPQLRLIGLDGRNDRIVIANTDLHLGQIEPYSFSADGRWLLIGTETMDRKAALSIVDITTGQVRPIIDLPEELPFKASLSPDAKWIAYDVAANPEAAERDIIIMSAAGIATSRITHHASESQPIWAPDNRHLLFSSDRSGVPAVWSVVVRDGVVVGEPALVQSGMSWGFQPVAFAGNTLYVVQDMGGGDLFKMRIESTTSTASNITKIVQSFEGQNISGSFTRDGRRVAFISRRGPVKKLQFGWLVIRDLDTGSEKVVSDLHLNRIFSRPRISPSGKHVIALDHRERVQRYVLADAETGSIAVIPKEKLTAGDSTRTPYVLDWTSDSTFLYRIARGRDASLSYVIAEYNIVTGAVREVFTARMRFNHSALAPDGTFAYAWANAPVERPSDTLIVRLRKPDGNDNEIARVVIPGSLPTWFAGLAFTPDNKALLYAKSTGRQEERLTELFLLPLDGTPPRSLGVTLREIRFLSRAGPGEIGFTAGPMSKEEIWAVDNISFK